MHLVNRLLGILLGLALAAVGGLVLVESIAFLLGNSPWAVPLQRWGAVLNALTWDNRGMVIALVAMTVVGALLLIAELAPRAPSTLELDGSTPQRAVSIDRRGLERRLRTTALRHPHVDDAKVKVRRRRIQVRAGVGWDSEPSQVRTEVASALEETVQAIGLQQRPRTSVRVERERGGVR